MQPFYKLSVLSLQKHFGLLDIHSLKLVAVGQQLVVWPLSKLELEQRKASAVHVVLLRGEGEC